MFRNRDSKGSRLQVVPTDDANWPQADLKAGTGAKRRGSVGPASA